MILPPVVAPVFPGCHPIFRARISPSIGNWTLQAAGLEPAREFPLSEPIISRLIQLTGRVYHFRHACIAGLSRLYVGRAGFEPARLRGKAYPAILLCPRDSDIIGIALALHPRSATICTTFPNPGGVPSLRGLTTYRITSPF